MLIACRRFHAILPSVSAVGKTNLIFLSNNPVSNRHTQHTTHFKSHHSFVGRNGQRRRGTYLRVPGSSLHPSAPAHMAAMQAVRDGTVRVYDVLVMASLLQALSCFIIEFHRQGYRHTCKDLHSSLTLSSVPSLILILSFEEKTSEYICGVR